MSPIYHGMLRQRLHFRRLPQAAPHRCARKRADHADFKVVLLSPVMVRYAYYDSGALIFLCVTMTLRMALMPAINAGSTRIYRRSLSRRRFDEYAGAIGSAGQFYRWV